MKKFLMKMRAVKATRWNRLTGGEKVLKAVMLMVKWGAIAAAVVTLFSAIFAVVVVLVVGAALLIGICANTTDYRRWY